MDEHRFMWDAWEIQFISVILLFGSEGEVKKVHLPFLFIARADLSLELAVPNSFTFRNTEVSFLLLPPSVIR